MQITVVQERWQSGGGRCVSGRAGARACLFCVPCGLAMSSHWCAFSQMVATPGSSSNYLVRCVNYDTMVAVDGFRLILVHVLVLVLVPVVFALATAHVSCTVFGSTWLYFVSCFRSGPFLHVFLSNGACIHLADAHCS